MRYYEIVNSEEYQKLDRLVDIKRQIRQVIDRVGDVTCRLVLEKRILLFEPWLKICGDLCMSRRWAQVVYNRAVAEVQEILDGMEKEG